nr:bifunctional oligoribonuclease/PAP phosphatase NrnA [Goodfellowiella coeruleoviolacea]
MRQTNTVASTETEELGAAVALLDEASDIVLLAHINPDADALGSALALGLALHRRGARVRVSFGSPSQVPHTLRELDSHGLIVPADQVPAAPPLLVALDTSSIDRLGRLANRVAATTSAGGAVLVIDHHVGNTRFGTTNLVDDQAEATALIVLRVLDKLGVELDEPVARCLYAGLVTDTRSFRHAGAEALRVAARLVETGVRAEQLTRRLMDSHPFAWLSMLSTVLGRATLDQAAAQGLGLVHTVITAADADGLRSEEVDSVMDVLRTTQEAEVAAVIKQAGPAGAPRQQSWVVSLRAVGRLDVGAVATRLGGGGHRLAAGFTTTGLLDEVLAALRAALSQAPITP